MPRGSHSDPRRGRGRAPNRRGHHAGGAAAGRGDSATPALRPRRLRPGLGARRRSSGRRGSPDPARPALTGHSTPGPARPAGCGLRTATLGLRPSCQAGAGRPALGTASRARRRCGKREARRTERRAGGSRGGTGVGPPETPVADIGVPIALSFKHTVIQSTVSEVEVKINPSGML
ncbi:translation initiation factor IF-2-like [Vidua chalybeata]|uniref:translation initiation factor IF-2-like n=1 Tax=Vidua chalybeata TaxID=81927 RepID=UPI0023A8F401|nr:translation initiation factor IF-2-like [Vidua chalybeata]